MACARPNSRGRRIAYGRDKGSFCQAIHKSSLARCGCCKRTPMRVPLPESGAFRTIKRLQLELSFNHATTTGESRQDQRKHGKVYFGYLLVDGQWPRMLSSKKRLLEAELESFSSGGSHHCFPPLNRRPTLSCEYIFVRRRRPFYTLSPDHPTPALQRTCDLPILPHAPRRSRRRLAYRQRTNGWVTRSS
jgi:hypothetical protein